MATKCRTVQQGNLKMKEHGILKDSWGKYYFVLKETPSSLVYYKSEDDFTKGNGMPVGSIAITEAVHIRTSAAKGNQQIIQIETAKSVHELRCVTQIAGQQWSSVLTDVVLKNTARGGQQGLGTNGTGTALPTAELDFNQLYAVRSKSYDIEMMSNPLVKYVGPCILEVSIDHLVVWRKEGKLPVVLVKWGLKMLRRYSFNESTFMVEVGRRSSTGEGVVTFWTTHGAEISKRIKMVTKFRNLKVQPVPTTVQLMNADTSKTKPGTSVGSDDKSSCSVMDTKTPATDHSVLRNPLANTVRSQDKRSSAVRQSRSLNDLLCGSHTLPPDMKSPVTALERHSKPFAPYHALHHISAETQPKHMDRYHHMQIEFTPGIDESFDQIKVKSPKLPYHHLEFNLPDQQDSAEKEMILPLERREREFPVEQQCQEDEPVYQNFPIQFAKESSADADNGIDINSGSPLYVNISNIDVSSQSHNNKSQDLDGYVDVDNRDQALPSTEDEKAHRSSGGETEEMSNLYVNIEAKQRYPNSVSQSEEARPVSDAICTTVSVVQVNKQSPLAHNRSKSWKEKRTGDSTNSGEYSYPVIRSIRSTGNRTHQRREIEDECHYYGCDVQLMDDESDYVVEHSPKQEIRDISRDQNFPTVVVSDVHDTVFHCGVQKVASSSQTTSLSAPSSPNMTRLYSPEALYEFKKELKLKVATRSLPTSIQSVNESSGNENQDHQRPRAYQMDRRRGEERQSSSTTDQKGVD